MKTPNWIKGLALLCAGALAANGSSADPVRVFAAASLQGPLDAAAAAWSGDAVVSYGGSGAIAWQVSQGAPADVIILANTAWADWLTNRGHVTAAPVSFLSNTLVLIAPVDQPQMAAPTTESLLAVLNGQRLAMGQHLSVPAGIYAQDWLHHVGAWDALRPQLAETENVRAALALVARGETPLGIVYKSDAMASDAVTVVYTIPPETHDAIVYPAFAVTPEGAAFLAHIIANSALFTDAGFRSP